MNEAQSKRELLNDKVVDLVKEFIKNEGGITGLDIQALFGPPVGGDDISTALNKMNVTWSS